MAAPAMHMLMAAGQSTAFSPLSLPNLVAWWDASDAATFTYSSGVVISQWNDKSGNAHHFSQSTVSLQPQRNGTQNGLSCITFDGVDDYLDTASFTVAQPLTIYVACGSSFSGSYGVFAAVGGSMQVIYGISTSQQRVYAGSAEIDLTTPPTNPHLYTCVLNGASSNQYVDNASESTANPGTSGTTTGFRTAERTLTYKPKANLFEVAVCSSAHGSSDRQAMYDYIKAKWATP